MPAQTFQTSVGTVVVDARPDRPDLRDRDYVPRLISLLSEYPPPAQIKTYFTDYCEAHDLILDQGQEGACTGFGLAAMINFVRYKEWLAAGKAKRPRAKKLEKVSPHMLYRLARLYDEWPGEDYSGSSSRGAMKGWFHHGVCTLTAWPNSDGPLKGAPPSPAETEPSADRPGAGPAGGASGKKGARGEGAGSRAKRAAGGDVRTADAAANTPDWSREAAECPIGAYYRVRRDAIGDLQAAIMEVGAVYVTANVHDGWSQVRSAAAKRLSEVPTIAWTPGAAKSGGHAFALVGYDRQGFIIQNSWGKSWGFSGFARVLYDDWQANGVDAWVGVIGAPVDGASPKVILSTTRNIGGLAPGLGRGFGNGVTLRLTVSADPDVWGAAEVARHSLVIGNHGLPVQQTVTASGPLDAAQEVCFDAPKAWLDALPGGKQKRIALYCHGGLNDLSAALKRVRQLGPAFFNNEIYPIFAVWQSGLADAIIDEIDDALAPFHGAKGAPVAGTIGDIFADKWDRFIETAVTLPGTSLWNTMKSNAVEASASQSGAPTPGGLVILADELEKLAKLHPGLEIHLVGHSAGANMVGAFLERLDAAHLKAATVSLYAPACTVRFALDTYAKMAVKGVIDPQRTYFDLLSDEREQSDTVGPYGKSLLYLASRSFELNKTPILGMEKVWTEQSPFVTFSNASADKINPDVDEWRKTWQGKGPDLLSDTTVFDGKTEIKSAHGCFDNWIDGVARTLNRIRGEKPGAALPHPIKDLSDF